MEEHLSTDLCRLDQDALCQACFDGNMELVQQLVTNEGTSLARVGTVRDDAEAKSPLSHACVGGQLEVVRFLLDCGEGDLTTNPVPGESTTPHVHAVPFAAILSEFSSRGLWPSSADTLWRRLCEADSAAGLTAAVAGANADHVNDALAGGNSPLHLACELSGVAVVTALLELGAQPFTVNERGRLPVHVACESDRPGVVAALVSAHEQSVSSSASQPGPIDWRTLCDNAGHTALALARSEETQQLLDSCGVKLNGLLADGETTALETAYCADDMALVTRLIEALGHDFRLPRGNVDSLAVIDATVPILWCAIVREDDDTFVKIVESVWLLNKDYAYAHGNQRLIRLLCYCAHNGYSAGIEVLRRKDVVLVDSVEELAGKTALDFACDAGRIGTARKLLRFSSLDEIVSGGDGQCESAASAELDDSWCLSSSIESSDSDEAELTPNYEYFAALAVGDGMEPTPTGGNSEETAAVDHSSAARAGADSATPACGVDSATLVGGADSSTLVGGVGSPTLVRPCSKVVSARALLLAELVDFPAINFADILPGRVLGRGSFGEVRSGAYRGRPVAYKVEYNDDGGAGSRRGLERTVNAARVHRLLQRADSAHCVRFVGVTADPTIGAAVVTEYVGGGSLKELMDGGAALDPVTALTLCCGLAAGVAHIHGAGVVHGDLKPANILIRDGEDGYVGKIADFGGASLYWRGRTEFTPRYAAPEVRDGQLTEAQADVYSLACVVFEVLAGSQLRSEDDRDHERGPLSDLWRTGSTAETVASYLPESLRDREIGELLCQCWNEDSHSRPTSSELLERLVAILDGIDAVKASDLAGYAVRGTTKPNPPLMTAIQYRARQEEVERLLDCGHCGDEANAWGHTALHVAAAMGDDGVVRALLATQPDIRADMLGVTPVDVAKRLCAVEQGPALVVTLLENYDTGLHVLSPLPSAGVRCPPLHVAAAQADVGFARCLVSEDVVFLHEVDAEGRTAVDVAIAAAAGGVVSYLLTEWVAWSDYHAVDWGRYFRAACGDESILRRVREVFLGSPGEIESSFLNVWKREVIDSFRLDSLEMVGAVARDQASCDFPLIAAMCQQQRWGAVDVLVGIEHDRGEPEPDGGAALLFAARCGLVSLAETLIEGGGNVNYASESGHTPLIAASSVGCRAAILALLEGGAEVNMNTLLGTALHLACLEGQLDVARLLLEHAADANAVTPTDGITALMDASLRGREFVVKLLLDNGADVNATAATEKGTTALMRATMGDHTEVVRVLVDNGADVNAADMGGCTALSLASKRGSAPLVKLLVEHSAEVNAVDKHGTTALMKASMKGNDSVAQLLLDNGADVNAARDDGTTALMWACDGCYASVVKLLVEHSAEVNAVDERGTTALMKASMKGNDSVAQLLLDNGADVNAAAKSGFTALHLASQYGRESVVKWLLDNGADVNAATPFGTTALFCASMDGHAEVVRLLLDNGADVNAAQQYGDTALMHSSRGGHTEVVMLLLVSGADVNACRTESRFTALMDACEAGCVDIAELLVGHGADMERRSSQGLTALMCACDKGHVDVAQFLINSGADVRAQDDSGRTVFVSACENGGLGIVQHLLRIDPDFRECSQRELSEALLGASTYGHTAVVQHLAELGADVRATTDDGTTALMQACKGGHVAVSRALLELGVDVNAFNADGETALQLAVASFCLKLVDLLINFGADVDAHGRGGATALIVSLRRINYDVTSMLLDYGADVNACDDDGVTALMKASGQAASLSLVRLLLAHGADVNATSKDGSTALILGSKTGIVEIVRALLGSGAHVHARTADGSTALTSASAKGHAAVVQLLLDGGANVHAVDESGKTALVLATESGHSECVALLAPVDAGLGASHGDADDEVVDSN